MMDHIYDYAILQVVPDPRRGERVNIGVVVFTKIGVDVRVCETRKLTALTSHSWDADILAFANLLKKVDEPSLQKSERFRNLLSIQNQFLVNKIGWFSTENNESYENQVRQLLISLVNKPRKSRPADSSSVVSEITATLRSADILAIKGDNLDSGKVFKNHTIESGLNADFVQLNSRLHVASVLDLRANNPQLAQAALKAVVLDRAAAIYDDHDVHKIGIFAAAPARISELHDNLSIIKKYADDLVNWEDPTDRESLMRLFFHGFSSHNGVNALLIQ